MRDLQDVAHEMGRVSCPHLLDQTYHAKSFTLFHHDLLPASLRL